MPLQLYLTCDPTTTYQYVFFESSFRHTNPSFSPIPLQQLQVPRAPNPSKRLHGRHGLHLVADPDASFLPHYSLTSSTTHSSRCIQDGKDHGTCAIEECIGSDGNRRCSTPFPRHEGPLLRDPVEYRNAHNTPKMCDATFIELCQFFGFLFLSFPSSYLRLGTP